MDQADMWGPARSYENGVWLVAATKSGYERSIYYPGGSMIVDPKGRVISKVPYDTHGMAVADIDLEAASDKSIYAANDKIADRRPETYGIMALPYEKTPVYRVAEKPLIPAKSVTKVAAIQMHAAKDCPADDVLDMIDHTAKLGAKVLLLPEYAFCASAIPTAAEAAALADRTIGLLAKASAIAAKYECLIALPSVERAGAGLFVTTFLIGPDGRNAGGYRKTHLTAEERKWAKAGDDYPVFETLFGRIGIMSGYDAVFPETSRCLGIGAADIILWPASLREPFERELLAVPRAEDNRVAVVLANRTDSPYPGGSVVIPPNGFPLWDINVVAPCVLKNGAVMPKHIDLAVCRQKLMIPKVDMFANRLVETYSAIIAA
jgi:predicted amidohydrolase